jgi:hypothetical protein
VGCLLKDGHLEGKGSHPKDNHGDNQPMCKEGAS